MLGATERSAAAQTVCGRVFPLPQFLVRFDDDACGQACRQMLGLRGLARSESLDPLPAVLLTATDGSRTAELISLLSSSPGTLWFEPNHRCRVALAEPNDPAYHDLIGDLHVQWPAHALDVIAAWERYPGSYFDAYSRPQDAPVIALIDTGVDVAHPDFRNPGADGADVSNGGQLLLSAARTLLSGDPDDGRSDVSDEHGHGTHLAGLVAAGTNNGVTGGDGVAGIGYNAVLLPLKVAGANGVATHADIARAVVYAADQGSSTILIAFSGPTWSRTLQDAVDYAWNRGCFLVAAAGDSGAGTPSFPAACPHVFAVSSLVPSGEVAGYSTSGEHVAGAAPGGDEQTPIYSTLPTYACTLRQDLTGPPYGWAFGTSQAAAHLAAAAGLYAGLKALRPDAGGEGTRIWQALQQSAAAADSTTPAEWQPDRGYGKLRPPALLSEDIPSDGRVGSIVGRVLLGGDPIVGASVAALSGTGELTVVQSSWPAGGYRISNMAPGHYLVTAEAEGFDAALEAVTVLAGCDTPGMDFRLGDPFPGAALVSAEIPRSAVRGATMTMSLTFANTGESVWRRADGYCLGEAACEPPVFDAPRRIELTPDEAIAPGEEREFVISLVVPDGIGFYETAWQMCQMGGTGAFGDTASQLMSVTSFLDVPADYWAVNEIEAANDAKVVLGYEDNCYRPTSAVSRDQMAVYLARALAGGEDAVPSGPVDPAFEDVQPDHWAYRHIEYVHGANVVHGYPDGSYYPGQLLDRAQMAVFVARAVAGGEIGLDDYVPPQTPTFADVPTGHWAYVHVEYLAAAGIVSGYPDHCYRPDYVCSRDQIAVYVAHAFNLSAPGSPAG